MCRIGMAHLEKSDGKMPDVIHLISFFACRLHVRLPCLASLVLSLFYVPSAVTHATTVHSKYSYHFTERKNKKRKKEVGILVCYRYIKNKACLRTYKN